MSQNLHIDRRIYGSQRIFVVENHEVALIPWAEIRRERSQAPILFTLDHHTDTRRAFTYAACQKAPGIPWDQVKWDAAQKRFLKATRFQDPEAVKTAVQNLKWDEHIATAIDADIVHGALVLAHDDSCATLPRERMHLQPCDVIPPRPHHYAVPLDRIFYIPNKGGGEFPFKDGAIDSYLLEQKIEDANDMLASLGRTTLDREEYILDVDLDYFLTPESLQPNDGAIFEALLRNAVGITIATEPDCVLRESGGKLTAERSLSQLEKHLVSACGERRQ